ncbi:Potassium channel subfamily T member 1 [Choanephora cucurbitarum]|uniref:Potassium channel subfamily T member 1 n=1 Tax=Choanephora cucurbitarum TaxID=101091 RepID=A0A1C7NRN4_9FUNG|nr:Potassium channel subfamily T member 1 [Choanephora cucurbitarum]
MAEEEKAKTVGLDEEKYKLVGSEQPAQYYGSTSHIPVSSSNTSSSSLAQPLEDMCSDGESSEEFMSSKKLATRKKKRLQKHHRPARPKLVSKLSHIVRSARQSEDEEDADDVIEMPTENLIIPELDPNAAEVRESVPFGCSSARKYRINLSNIREKYRDARIHERYGNVPLTNFERIKNLFQYDAYVSEARRILFANRSIILFVYTDLMVDVLLCLAYLVEMKQEADIHATPPWMFKWRSYDLCFRAFIETFTTIPFIVSIFMDHGQYLYVPYFLRSWVLLLRIKSVLKIKTNLLMTDKPVDPLKSKLVYLVGTLVALLYNGMSAFQYCEVTFGDINYSILDSLYVVMVTLSTVGYGDITPHTEGSRIVMMLLIVISLAVLPNLLADVLNTLRKRNDWGGHVPDSAKPFILLVGSFRPEQVTEILDGFLNTEHTEPHLNVVFLDTNRPNEELKFLERNSMWGHRIQFIHGSVLDEQTLKRVQARSASAIFTLSDQHAPDPIKEDERNTVRLWSLHCFTVSHNVDIYTYNLSPSTSIYQKMAKEIICVREFKQYLLAMNCRCRGASTLLTNLLHQRRPMDHYDESWQAQYDDGSCNEIYMDTPPSALIGQTFKEAAWIVYTECQVVLFGIKTFIGNSETKEILLNPGNNYVLKAEDICVYMCESPREVEDVNTLQYDYVKERIDKMKLRRQNEAEAKRMRYQESSKSRSSSLRNELLNTIRNSSMSQQQQETKSAPTSPRSCASNIQHEVGQLDLPQPQIANSVQLPVHHPNSPTLHPIEPLTHSVSNGSTRSTVSSVSNINHSLPPLQQFELAKLPTPRLALLTGNRKLVSRLGKTLSTESSDVDTNDSPACYLLKEPATLEELTLESAEHMSGHILVCMHHKVSNIFKFIYNLRSPQLLPKYLQNIVFLCTSLPSDKQFELVQRFPRVYFMVGNCQHPEDLIRAGVKKAKQVVVMSEMECLDQNERSSDSPAIMTSHLLDLILQDKPQDASRIVNLVEKSNIRFMHLLQGKDVAEEVDVFYTPAYAAGNVVVDSLLSNVLLSQTYYKPDIVSVIKALCSMPGPTHDNNATNAMLCPSKFKQQELPCSRHLTLSVMPPCFIDRTFACLFETLLMDHDVLPLGLLRAPDENMGNELSFVYTNPVPSLVLKRTDKIYLLASPGWSFFSQQ